MVLDALRIGLRGAFVDADRAEELHHDLMARACLRGQRAPARGQPERRTRVCHDVALARESPHHAAHGHMGKTETLRDAAHARLDACIEEFGDHLAVVLRGLRLVLLAQHAVALRRVLVLDHERFDQPSQVRSRRQSLRGDLVRLRTTLGSDAPDATLMVGMAAWSAVMGAISLELFGHLHNVVDQPGALFDAVVEQHGRIIMGTDRG